MFIKALCRTLLPLRQMLVVQSSHVHCSAASYAAVKKTTSAAGGVMGLGKGKKKGGKISAMEKKEMPVETDPVKLVNYVCGSNIYTTGEDVKILSSLSFLASGSYQKIVGMNIRNFVSQPSISRSLHQIINALCHQDVVKKFIRFPQNASERQKLKEIFYEKFGIPGVIGCIDGTLVAMVRPKDNEERYFCRKGYHARNVQLIKDDSEYPEWLWSLNTGRAPPLEELDPNTKQYWTRVRAAGMRRNNKLRSMRKF